jgi:hypothetical protein
MRTSPPLLRLRSPADLLAAVPYLLGFHPTDSVVLLALRGSRVIFHARLDAPPAGADRLERAQLADYLAAVTVRQSPTAALLIGYGDEPRIGPALAAMRTVLTNNGVPVEEMLRVAGGRFWSYMCQSAACCPPAGQPFDISTSRVAAAATFAGCVALPDREALRASLAPQPGPGLEPEIARAEDRLRGLRAAGSRRRRSAARVAVREAFERYATGARLDDDELAWLAVLVAYPPARDDAWQRMLLGPSAEEHLTTWRDVVRRVPERYAPAPATLLALGAWRAGDGALAWLAVDRALAADPAYQLAELISQALRSAIPPSVLEGERAHRRRVRRA